MIIMMLDFNIHCTKIHWILDDEWIMGNIQGNCINLNHLISHFSLNHVQTLTGSKNAMAEALFINLTSNDCNLDCNVG